MRVRQWQRNNPEISCHVEGFCNEMHFFLQVSDMVVTRGGTTTCSEALHFECPIIFNGIGGVMPQEQLTVKYFMQDNAAAKVTTPKEFDSLLIKWSRFPERFRALRRRFKTMKFQDRPSEAIYDLVDLAHEALPVDQCPALKIVGE